MLSPSMLRADIIIGFWPIPGFAEFEYIIFDERSDNFSRFYGMKQAFFMILQVTYSDFFAEHKSLCMF